MSYSTPTFLFERAILGNFTHHGVGGSDSKNGKRVYEKRAQSVTVSWFFWAAFDGNIITWTIFSHGAMQNGLWAEQGRRAERSERRGSTSRAVKFWMSDGIKRWETWATPILAFCFFLFLIYCAYLGGVFSPPNDTLSGYLFIA